MTASFTRKVTEQLVWKQFVSIPTEVWETSKINALCEAAVTDEFPTDFDLSEYEITVHIADTIVNEETLVTVTLTKELEQEGIIL